MTLALSLLPTAIAKPTVDAPPAIPGELYVKDSETGERLTDEAGQKITVTHEPYTP